MSIPKCSQCGENLAMVCPHCTQITFDAFVLHQDEMRAIVRQTLHQYIPTEGTSGPVLHALLGRIREHVGRDKYNEFTREPTKK